MSKTCEVKLRDGREVIIRPITTQDASARHHFFVELSQAQNGMVHTIDEIDYHTSESLEQITDFLRNHSGLWLIALAKDGTIIAEVDILRQKLARVRHNGRLTIGVLPEFQNVGLGSLLLDQALEWAKQQRLKRVELFVFKSNIAAQNLYKKFNFVIEGCRHNFLRHQNDTFEDDLLMAAYL